MEVNLIHAEDFKLDGGACFGVVPKSIWNKIYPADENNMVEIATRLFLVREGDRLILFDTGIGNKQRDKLLAYYYVANRDNLINSFANLGISPDDVTDVVFTHLHFDHSGGAFRKNDDGEAIAVFRNANYWVSRAQWDASQKPNQRERASYYKENLNPLIESGKLHFIEQEGNFTPNIFLHLMDGHTDGQLIPVVQYKNKTLAYVADLIPTFAHLSLPFLTSFDVRPLLSLEEKQQFLQVAADNNYILVFEHDALHPCCTVQNTDRGAQVDETGTLEYFMNK